jgi:O-antigen/teichoic acid export membrane protein
MGGRSWSATVWKMVPLCLLWCLWRERNAKRFEDLERSLEELKSFFFFSLFTWIVAYLAPLVINFPKFLVIFSSSS